MSMFNRRRTMNVISRNYLDCYREFLHFSEVVSVGELFSAGDLKIRFGF